jgi:hypothetical protein
MSKYIAPYAYLAGRDSNLGPAVMHCLPLLEPLSRLRLDEQRDDLRMGIANPRFDRFHAMLYFQ